MARPNWEYIRVDVLLPSHPKLDGVGVESKWCLIELWCYCAQHLTDGFVPEHKWRSTCKASARRVLVDRGFAEKVTGGYQMHDYLGHQRSRLEAEELSRKRAEAGRKGGKAKANAVAKAKQVPDGLPASKPSKTQAEAEAEAEAEIVTAEVGESSSVRNAQGGDEMIDLIISEIHQVTGRIVKPDWAAAVCSLLLGGRDPDDPFAYVRAAIRSERNPRERFLPAASDHPSARSPGEAALAAGIVLNGSPARGGTVAEIAAAARQAMGRPA